MTGHRARLRRKFLENGIGALSQAQIIELLLFYTIPRRDTLPIAERLLERFGSLNGVFTAEISKLASVQGVSRNSAVLLRAAADIFIEYAEPDFIGKISADDSQAIEKLLESMTKEAKEAGILAVFTDENGFAARVERFLPESSAADEIAKTALEHGFPRVVCKSFGADELLKELAQRLRTAGVKCDIY